MGRYGDKLLHQDHWRRPQGGSWRAACVPFGEVPRAGEFIGFSRDGKRDDRGVLSQDLYRVKRVIHTAATELNPAMIILDVVLEQPVD
ncbi:hypothetical protein LB572_09600 [Mesorhizobium sp. BH1-1-5]|uniref:hypothetical protein n=1 Tax=Mesorhizobium sp. BH1-1-5 TaxID=2876661 RepID=UPI001CCE2117|nr:hypothetical protein [Mesorhizobium sp. BH1-1-5]MBZ9987351.1 hypothetical protein [Mesorhizobium sp. BH1-1-5]